MARKKFVLILKFLWLCFPLLALDPASDLPELGSRAAVLLDAGTGTLLYAKNGDEEIPPASLTKLMTIHIALEEVAAGRASLDETVPLPRESWAVNQPPRSSLMFLAQGQRVSLRELILGLAIPSGNDAAVAVALRFAPTVGDFAGRMTAEARRLGLTKTRFVEPSGISEYNITTALEFARFCGEYLRFHPEAIGEYHSVREFAYPKSANVAEAYRDRPGTIPQYNRNALLGIFAGVDGLKTGYIDEAGYNIALTAARGDTRFIAVLLGSGDERGRTEDGKTLLNWGFEHYKTLRPVISGLPPVRVWKGKANYAAAVPGETAPDGSLAFTARTGRGGSLHWEAEPGEAITAPLPAGSPVGTLVFYDEIGELRRVPLAAGEDIEAGGFFKRLWDSIVLFFKGLAKKN
jgi:D-alanyl-D-alanine carboxypeptidase (penicillin-binding protein 5/6)